MSRGFGKAGMVCTGPRASYSLSVLYPGKAELGMYSGKGADKERSW